jgi:hypothetical protein
MLSLKGCAGIFWVGHRFRGNAGVNGIQIAEDDFVSTQIWKKEDNMVLSYVDEFQHPYEHPSNDWLWEDNKFFESAVLSAWSDFTVLRITKGSQTIAGRSANTWSSKVPITHDLTPNHWLCRSFNFTQFLSNKKLWVITDIVNTVKANRGVIDRPDQVRQLQKQVYNTIRHDPRYLTFSKFFPEDAHRLREETVAYICFCTVQPVADLQQTVMDWSVFQKLGNVKFPTPTGEGIRKMFMMILALFTGWKLRNRLKAGVIRFIAMLKSIKLPQIPSLTPGSLLVFLVDALPFTTLAAVVRFIGLSRTAHVLLAPFYEEVMRSYMPTGMRFLEVAVRSFVGDGILGLIGTSLLHNTLSTLTVRGYSLSTRILIHLVYNFFSLLYVRPSTGNSRGMGPGPALAQAPNVTSGELFPGFSKLFQPGSFYDAFCASHKRGTPYREEEPWKMIADKPLLSHRSQYPIPEVLNKTGKSMLAELDGVPVEMSVLLSDKPPRQPRIFPIAMSTCVPFAPTRGTSQVARAVLFRLGKTPKHTADSKIVHRATKAFIARFKGLEMKRPLCTEVYLERHVENSKRAAYRRAHEDYQAGVSLPIKKLHLKMDETLPLKRANGKWTLKPRLIQSEHPVYHIECLPWTRNAAHFLARYSSTRTSGKFVYGSNWQQSLSKYVTKKLSRQDPFYVFHGDDMVVFYKDCGVWRALEGDASMFESSQGKRIHLARDQIYREVFDFPEEVISLLNDTGVGNHYFKGKDGSFKVRLEKVGCTGSADTSLRNSICTSLACERIIFEAAYQPADAVRVYSLFGFELKARVDDLIGVEFLSGWFVESRLGMTWIPNPVRRIAKLGKVLRSFEDLAQRMKCTEEHVARAILYGQGASLESVPHDFPLLAAWREMAMRLGCNDERFTSYVERNPYLALTGFYPVDRQTVLDAIYANYGLDGDAIKEIESMLLSADAIPFCYHHPRLYAAYKASIYCK